MVADLSGRVVGTGLASGGNPVARGLGPAMAAIRAALEQALDGLPRGDVAGNVVGAAGFGAGSAHAALAELWRELGLPGGPVVAGDIEVAFASGTDALDGSVLVSGTGAIAGEFLGGRQHRVADGVGWLLGDHGSGFWVGREAVRHALSTRRDPDDPLAAAVAQALTGSDEVDRQALIDASYGAPPVRLSELARLVVTAADGGSAPATAILEAAAEELLAILHGVRDPGETSVVVLGGGLLGTAILQSAVRERIARSWPGSPVTTCGSGVGGALWLAARGLGVELPAGLHAALTTTA
jgi:N-acetylglucosamine kinase-like BadF-type ATPase